MLRLTYNDTSGTSNFRLWYVTKMSSTRPPVKPSRPGSVSDAQHQTKSSSSQREKEPAKVARRLPSLATDKDDTKKSTTPGKPPSKQQQSRIRTKSESSDKLGSEDGETQKKSKAELRAERRAVQVIILLLAFYDD